MKSVSYLINPKILYIILTLFVMLFLISHAYNQRWGGDFWQHSAAVHELSLNPWSPSHPHLPVSEPHEFYNPYSLFLGLISRVTGLSSIMVLSIMGIVNFVFLSYALRRFCIKLSTNLWTPLLTLLFTLVLWGYHPWMWSGFFHLAALGDTTTFPSCFCAALTFMAWSVFVDFMDKKANFLQPIFLLLLMFVVSITHPHTSVVLFVGLFALWLNSSHKQLFKTIVLLGITLVSISATLVWPYYPFLALVINNQSIHYAGNSWMYSDIIRQTFAGLIFLPCVIGRLRKNLRDPIGLMFLMFVIIYTLGYITGKYALGRSIVYIMFCLHFSAADWLANIQTHLAQFKNKNYYQYILSRIAILIILIFTIGFFAVGVYRYRPGRNCTYTAYTFLPDYVKQSDIIMTDINTSLIVPSFAGKVVGTKYYQAFIKDSHERQKIVNRFFSDNLDNKERVSILKKYNVNFILLNEHEIPSKNVQDEILKLGRVIYSKDGFNLIDVRVTGSTGKEPNL